MLLLALLATPATATDREAVLDLAAQYTVHSWTATRANTESCSCDSDWVSDYDPGTYTGLPYDWGGYVTLAEFDEQLAAGYGAGGHSDQGSLWCTTGVDCSGYVSELWRSGHYSTSTFYAVTSDIGWSSLTRGDAINDAGSHIVLYTHTSEGGWPVFYESCGSYGVRLNNTGGWGYVSDYQPVRYDDISDGHSTGTFDDPREITAFPFEDSRWTAGAASDVLDAYSCSPDSDEGGPEVIYHFRAATRGTLTARVSDDSGVDIDLHVLDAPDAQHCLTRDDTDVSVEVGPGDVWLALDSYVGSSGTEYPGPFVLTADFTGSVGDPPAEDTGTPADTAEDSGAPEDTSPAGDDTATLDTAPPPPGATVLPGTPVDGGGVGGCATAPGPRGLAVFGLLALLLRRRR